MWVVNTKFTSKASLLGIYLKLLDEVVRCICTYIMVFDIKMLQYDDFLKIFFCEIPIFDWTKLNPVTFFIGKPVEINTNPTQLSMIYYKDSSLKK